MARFKRLLLIGIALLALLLLGLGVWVYQAVYGKSSTAIQLAEAFNFRRLQVSRMDDSGSYRFFFATNRQVLPGDAALEESFGREREASLKFGFFDTVIEQKLGIGMIIDRTAWFQNEAINISGVEALQRTAFIERLQAKVQKSPLRSLLVVVHGFREAFPSALRKTAFVSHVLDIDTPMLLFDWPGNQGSSLTGYRRARRVAEESGAELAQTLELIIREVRPNRLWLVANSMGGQVVAHAFSRLYQNTDLADTQTEFDDVILTAPDVDHEEFDNQFKKEIAALTRNLTVYVSSNDRALLMSRLINRSRQRGKSTLDPDMLDEAIKVTELIDPDSELVTLVDVTPVNRTRNFHNFSLETPEFFDDLYLRLVNERTPQSRLLHRLETPDGKNYWILTRGR